MTDTMRYEIRSVGVIRPLAWTDDYDLAVAICSRLGVDTRDGRLLYVFDGDGGEVFAPPPELPPWGGWAAYKTSQTRERNRAPAWKPSKAYSSGEIIRYGGHRYRTKLSFPPVAPANSPYWERL